MFPENTFLKSGVRLKLEGALNRLYKHLEISGPVL